MKIFRVFVFFLLVPLHGFAQGMASPCSAKNALSSESRTSPDVQILTPAEFRDLESGCTALLPGSFSLYVTISGMLGNDTAEEMLERIGRISSLRGIKYWSITDKSWQILITGASALTEPAAGAKRPDFTPEEFAPGQTLYFEQNDNRSTDPVVYKMDILEAAPGRILFAVENITPVVYHIVSAFESGALRSVYLFEKTGSGSWIYYSLSGVRERWKSSDPEALKSYANRAVAMYRHFAGIPTDQDPPARP